MPRLPLVLGLAGLLLASCAQNTQTKPPFKIGTGGSTGVYYVLGQSICKKYGESKDPDLPSCTAPASAGSSANLKALAEGSVDMAIAYSTWVKTAAEGTSGIAELGTMGDLRAIASFYPEPLNLLVRRDAGIDRFADLPKARVGLANDSWSTALFRSVMRSEGWTEQSFASVRRVDSTSASLDALCRGEVDAIPVATGHPSGNIKRATESCGAKLIAITGPEIADEIAGDLALAPAEVPAGLYAGQDQAIATFGPRPILVTLADAPDGLVRAVAEAIFRDLEGFKRLHPAFAPIVPEEMISAGIPVPLHPAAAAYYREIGLLN
ncbi:MAG: TAXI family TRAP transporter solute-binding subunit [Kiloniellaceae bacterium]